MEIIPGKYRHYKGKEYLVLGEARHSETEEIFVVYQPQYGDRKWWIRPKFMFLEQVLVEGTWMPRFEKIAD